jgi:MFS family permease
MVFAALLLTFGRLADRFGRRLDLLVGVVVFVVSSIAAGQARSRAALIASRAVQGGGANTTITTDPKPDITDGASPRFSPPSLTHLAGIASPADRHQQMTSARPTATTPPPVPTRSPRSPARPGAISSCPGHQRRTLCSPVI